jgi:hypothetical protein
MPARWQIRNAVRGRDDKVADLEAPAVAHLENRHKADMAIALSDVRFWG